MGDCLLPIFVHSGKRQISPSFCSLVGPCQEIKANFVFGILKNTKQWNIRSVFIFNLFPSTTKLRANSLTNKFHHFTPIRCQKVCSVNVGYVALSELSVFRERRINLSFDLGETIQIASDLVLKLYFYVQTLR